MGGQLILFVKQAIWQTLDRAVIYVVVQRVDQDADRFIVRVHLPKSDVALIGQRSGIDYPMSSARSIQIVANAGVYFDGKVFRYPHELNGPIRLKMRNHPRLVHVEVRSFKNRVVFVI